MRHSWLVRLANAVYLKVRHPMLRVPDPTERLVLAKANSRSTVYRANYLDYVSVKRLGPDGAVAGEFRFLGLYSHAAYTAPIAPVPTIPIFIACPYVLRRGESAVATAFHGRPPDRIPSRTGLSTYTSARPWRGRGLTRSTIWSPGSRPRRHEWAGWRRPIQK